MDIARNGGCLNLEEKFRNRCGDGVDKDAALSEDRWFKGFETLNSMI